MINYRKSLLEEILAQPTAPFREGRVIAAITQTLMDSGIPHFQDPVGNIVIGVQSQTQYIQLVHRSSPEPLRIFMAHMDHPGFHGIRWKTKTELEVKWFGGSPTLHLEGAPVWVADRSGKTTSGKLKNAQLLPSKKALSSGVISFSSPELATTLSPTHLFGGFSFRSPAWTQGELIYTKAADDLVGCFAVLSLALDFWERKKPRTETPFLGLLTRAEEVGFIGAIGHFQLNWLDRTKRPIICVSLETSRTLPGAEIGQGPVVRLGDKYTVFDPGYLRVFSDLAHSILPEKHQRRIMDGGTCEATAATAFGFPSIGISVPLGNYHNQSFEGGPDSALENGPAPEFVHIQDLVGLIELCHGLLKPKLPWTHPWRNKVKELKKNYQEYSSWMSSEP